MRTILAAGRTRPLPSPRASRIRGPASRLQHSKAGTWRPAPSWLLSLASFLLLPAACFLLGACVPQPLAVTHEPVTLRLASADACEPLAAALAAAYEETHPWATVRIETSNDALAVRALRASEVDLALLSWLDDDAEPLWSHPFARDGVAVIAHPTTPFTQTSLALLEVIFRGQVQEWEGIVLTAVSREEGSGTRAAFERTVLGGHETTLTAIVVPSDAAVVDTVARTPGAMGYVSTLWVTGIAPGEIRVLPVEGILPGRESVADGSYPLWRPLYLAALADPAGAVREFAQWTVGPDGQDVVTRQSAAARSTP